MSDEEDFRTAVIVEDDPDLRHLIGNVFESAGFSVVSVGNGLDGVRAALAYSPLITSLDVSMPGIDGFEAARRIRAGGSQTFIIMVTAMGEEADVVQGLSSGADDYIVKPFRPREFRARIDAFLRRPRRADTGVIAARQQDRVGPSFPAVTPSTPPPHAPAPDHASRADISPGHAPPSAPVEASTAHEKWMSDAPQTVHRHTTAAEHSMQIVQGHFDDDVIEGEIDDMEEPRTTVARRDPHTGWMRHRDLFLDPVSRRVEVGDRPIVLTETEFELLHTIMSSRRRIRSKADLTLVLRGESYVTSYYVGDADKRAIQAHIDSLRRKLGELTSPTPRYVEAVRDVGYRLTPELDA